MTSPLLTDRARLADEAVSDLGYAPLVVTMHRAAMAGVDARDRDMRRALAQRIAEEETKCRSVAVQAHLRDRHGLVSLALEDFAQRAFGPRWRDDIDTERVAPDGGGGCPSDDDGNGPASADAERNPPSAATPRRSAR